MVDEFMEEKVEELSLYAPLAVYVITLLIQLKIFAREEELTKLEAKLMTYMAENFVREENYRDNHKALQDQMAQIHNDVSDVKNLLIGIINANNQRN